MKSILLIGWSEVAVKVLSLYAQNSSSLDSSEARRSWDKLTGFNHLDSGLDGRRFRL